MPTHVLTVTLTCNNDAFTFEEAIEYLNDHLSLDADPPGFGTLGKMTIYDDQGNPDEILDVEWSVE